MTTHLPGGPASARRPRLSPRQITEAGLPRTRLGRRGYEEHVVRLLLRRIAGDVAEWMAEVQRLRAENERIKTALTRWQSQFAPPAGHPLPRRGPTAWRA